MDWDDYPVILGFGTTHEMRDADHETPRLYGLKSVSNAAMWALHKKPAPPPRQVGFVRRSR